MNLFKQIKNLASDSTSSSGTIQNWYITAERAEGIIDKDVFSKSDPYLKIQFGGKHVRTRTIKNDRSPIWNETFHFKLNSNNAKDIQLTLKDSDIGLDDLIGTATISRAELPCNPGEEKSFKIPVFRKDQVGGIVYLRIKQMADGTNLSQTSYQTNTISQPQNYCPPKQAYNPQPNNYSYNVPYTQQQGYNQSHPPQYYNQSHPPQYYNQSQPPYYNQSHPPQYYNQSQPPYNQNQYNQGHAPPMNQPYQAQPHYQQQSNYPYNQYQQRPY